MFRQVFWKNRTLIEMVQCMMQQSRSPPSFLAEAVNTANYKRNRGPTTAFNGEIPYTMWKDKKPTLKYIKVFEAKVY